MTTKSAKHANKTFGSAKDESAKAVDMRKVAALSAGAASVIAGAAIAFGATPAMAAETPASAPVKTTEPVKEQELTNNKKKAEGAEASKGETTNSEVKKEAKKEAKKEESKEAKEEPKKEQTKPAEQAVAKSDGNTDVTKTETGSKVESTASVDNKDVKQDTEGTSASAGSVVNKRTKRSLDEDKQPGVDAPGVQEDRASNNDGNAANQDPNKIKPNTTDSNNTKIEINENNAETMPNAYAWGSSDNTYSVDGEKHTVTFHFAKPKDGNITSIAIFPSKTNGFNNEKSERGIDFYSKNSGKHQAYSGEYIFAANPDGSATLTMSTLFRDGNLNGGAEKYTASRSIFVYVTKDGSSTETIAYKTNVFRAVTLVPPKTSGSVVLKYNQELTPEKVQAAITEAGNVETARSDKKSVNDQLSGKFTENINVSSADAYDKTTFDAINKETSAQGATNKTYVAGAKTLNTYMVTDLGFKSGAIPLTVARYDDRIDKPIVEDPTQLSQEVKEDIAKKLAKINGVTTDKITFDADGNAVIHFDGVDENDAPKIALRDLVLKKIAEADVTVPTGDKAVFVANPLDYSIAELNRIKQSILEANKNNQELGLTSVDQISLSYLTGDLTATGSANTGISNGQAENTITVKIKTDKAVAEFTSDVKASKLTKLPNIRTDYDVTWTSNKIDKRDTDEGLSWSEDKKTIIYRYDPTAAQEFDTNKILNLLKATPKGNTTGLPTLTGGEKFEHEGAGGKAKKSHVGYVLKDDQPTTELSLGNMDGAYWKYSRQVDNSGVNLGDEESNAGSYSWDEDAKPVVVAAKGNKVYKARLFVLPYGLTMYRNIYIENGKNPGNTTKAINVIFVPQTNHKKADLKASVDKHAVTKDEKKTPTDSTYYNASDAKKAAYDEALKKANDALKEAGNTEDSKLSEELKARIDNATIRLDKARAALDGAKTDKSKLEQDIKDQGNPKKDNTAASGTYETDKYKNVTEPSFLKDEGGKLVPDTDKNNKAAAAKTAYDKALEEANKVSKDANATQKAVDEAKAKLDEARKELDKYSTNKDKLNAAIAEHGQVKTGKTDSGTDINKADPAYQNANEAERKAYDDAVKKANDLSKDPKASQKDVNEAITALENAKAALDAKATDKTKLAVAVQQTFDNPDPDNANGQKSTFYKNALGKKANGSEEEKAKAAAAIKAYDEALKKAKDILADANGTATQAQVDAAVTALTDAEDKLHEGYSTNKNDLTKALADNIDGYLKPAYFNAFDKAQAGDQKAQQAFKDYNEAYQKAKELKKKFAETDLSKQPTDEECKTAKEALEKARQVIDKYATDTSKLSAAFWNDLAIHNSPAYKNAQALVDKQNPTEDEKAQVAAAKKIKKDYDDAVAKLHKAFSNTLDKDKDAQGTPFAKIPDPNGDLNAKNYLDGIQAHENGEPLDRDVTRILTAMNDAADQLKQFATKTDKLQESINKDTDTQKDPAYKNARDPHKLGADGLEDTSGYDAIKQKAKAYDDALKDAKALMIKPDATQEDVNAALKKLDEARTALEGYKTNVEDLKKSVEAHGSTDGTAVKEGTVTSDAYRNASDPHFLTADGKPDGQKNNKAATDKKAYDAALLKAQDLLKKADPDSKTPLDAQPTQKQIDEALTELNEKRKALDTYKTDTSKLDEEAKKSTAEGATVADVDFEATPEFKNAKAKTSDGNENADVTAYKTALANARDLVKAATSTDPNTKNSNRPTQQQVDEALASLKKAKKQIEDNYKTNFEALTSAKDFADDGFKKTPEYKNALAKKDAGDQGATKDLGEAGQDTGFDNVLKKVTDKLNDTDWKGKVTQKFVNELLKKLQTAQDNIANKYKTDAIKLEYEVGDKNQDGKPVTPPFEASVPYKNALEKAKTEDPATTDPNSATKKLEAYNEKLKAAQELINKVNNPDPNAKPEDRPTQAQVDKALQDLKDAKTAIDNAFKTNASSLKKEADDKDETGQEHNPKFEQTTEYLNALAKKTGDEDIPDVKAYKDALKKAQDLLKKFNDDGSAPKQGEKDIPTQKEVDEALKNLKDIKDKITKNYVTSPHDLQEEVDKSKDGEDDTSTDVFENTPEFKNATAKGDDAAKQALKDYNDKLDAAKKLLDAFDRTTGKPKSQLPKGMDKAPTQQELDKALKDLQDAKKKITDGYKTNKSDLNTEAGKDSDFTKTPEYQNAQAKGDDASKQALDDYKKALEDANKVLGDKDATQAQVDEALKKLQDAKKKLSDGYKTDKSDLTVEAGKDSDFTQSPEYQNAAGSSEAEAYKQALEDANKVLGDKNATQAQVDEALRRLKDAKQKLTDSHKTDKSDLNTEAGKDPDFRKSIPFIIGKAADLAEYQQALNDADSVLKDPNATQDQVNRALRRLRDAKQKLIDAYNRLINSGSGVGDNTGVGVNDSNNTSVNNVVDKSALQAEADQALGDVSANASGVVADSNLVSEFNAALNYARSVLADANATQGQVDSALARLRAARAALRAGMLVARNSAGMNLKRGDVSGVNTGASSSVFAAFAAVFAGLGVVGAASKRRKHSAR
ncbi:FIVAR domain-containing protein [Gardnerella vaginalis]|uniref:FIVAR domain-containing protein n=1 Tax=Gardnerella vaginalis TaxID=2702 RepID=UPI000C9BAE55|nr:FIVAR domain-containing protein [Gardnerella vaginalis]PMC49157.1 peptidase [Gardnerella vaginalis]